MPKRFNTEKYNPTTDSSATLADYNDAAIEDGAEGGIFLNIEAGMCGCGCEQAVAAGREFRQGHDARLKGKLIRAYLTGNSVHIVGGGMMMSADAMTLAERRGWGKFLVAAKDRAERLAPKGRKPKTVKIKIAGGREVDAVVIGPVGKGQVEYEYTNAKGEAKRVTRKVNA